MVTPEGSYQRGGSNEGDAAITSAASRRTYRGGFSTSICGLFDDPRRRNDCCALACCGILASDRTRFLLTQQPPPNWFLRIGINFGLPVALLLSSFLIISAIPDDDTASLVSSVLIISFFVLIIVLRMRCRSGRKALRREILLRLFAEQCRERGEEALIERQVAFMRTYERDVHVAHRRYSCYTNDQLHYITSETTAEEETITEDVCGCMWNFFKKTFFDGCCGCWFQVCGMCALGQEERETNRMVPKADRMIDYVTFQPYMDYFPALEHLRINRMSSIIDHFKALSKLSVKMLNLLGGFLVLCFLISLIFLNVTLTVENLIVLLATFGQAFLILFFVHWKWHKFNVSFDAVVKYFACGFIISTSLAMVFEMIVQSVIGAVMTIVTNGILAADGTADEMNDPNLTDDEKANDMAAWVKSHPAIFIFVYFLNSFFVAALVEELCKYFGYWMVEHPDFLPPEDLVAANGIDISTATSDNRASSTAERVSSVEPNDGIISGVDVGRQKSMTSLGAGVTVAMVSAAMGFACCENLVYVFIYTPHVFGTEVSTLLARCLFPVHPLCAAIQSIGICRRDIECDKSWQLGRSILPAILLHGSFDFSLMVIGFLQGSGQDPAGDATGDDAQQQPDVGAELLPLIISMLLVLLGTIYYVCGSRAQKRRLEALENARLAEGGFDSRALLV